MTAGVESLCARPFELRGVTMRKGFQTKRILIVAVVVTAIAAGVVFFVTWNSERPLSVSPVPKNAPTLNQADVEKLLQVKQFRTVRLVRQLPSTLKQSFTNSIGIPFDMVDPGKPMSTDNIIPGVPTRRLIFAGVSDDSAILVYEQGGYTGEFNVLVFWYGDGGRNWKATLNTPASDIPSLRRIIEDRQFRTR